MKINCPKLTCLVTLSVCLFVGWFLDQPGSRRSHAVITSPVPCSNEVNLVIFGDWGCDTWSSHLRPVATEMQRYLELQGKRFNAAFLAGDNFYCKLRFGAYDSGWERLFQQPFAAHSFAMPFYVALGNHDYSKDKLAAEFAYVQRDPTHRWKLPSKWYAVDFPPDNPLVTVLVLDSNIGRLTSEEREHQVAWLESRLAAARNTPWLIALAHHPLFSNGHCGDSPRLIDDWGPLLKEHGVDFYVCGHDHGLQHLQIDGCPVSFLVSGGGGAKLEPMERDDRGPFSRSMHGFLHLQLTPDQALARFVSIDGTVLHEFTRQRAGAVGVARIGGRDKPVLARHDPKEEP
jgi:tartrate-resistant acid phosphatase type 5